MQQRKKMTRQIIKMKTQFRTFNEKGRCGFSWAF